MGYYRLFVSSTSDLATEREAIRDLLRDSPFEPYLYEHDEGLKEGSPRRHLERQIRRSTLFVLLLGRRFGSPYDDPDAPDDLKDPSIVEWEHEEARKRLRPTAIRGFEKSYPEGVEIEPEQQRFRERLGDFHRGQWIHRFDSEDQERTLEKRLTRYLLWWQSEPRRRLLQLLVGFLVAIGALAGVVVIDRWTPDFWLLPSDMQAVLAVLAVGASVWVCWRLLTDYRGR